ncbi:lysosomal thioesterase PPT2-B-like [Cololabis saira]|uniref:lysosomal thioesterase PPT2-B-like n=1 Tax=Cololabis saira TaxID=129043 RepID=UPI002AD532D8|nr:lysosomal thioesterase PPT2-B-like [Cololabis saira]
MPVPRLIQGSTALLPLLLLLLLAAGHVDGYKPVLIVHGIFNEPKDFQMLTKFIKKVHPGTEVHVINLYNNLNSLKPMWEQVLDVGKVVSNIMSNFPNGVHLLGFSQGGLVCRAVLSLIPNHNVHSFISLSSPLAGQFGVTAYLSQVIPKHRRKNFQKHCYKRYGQRLSICNYWKDPHLKEEYLRNNMFLPLLNGEKPHSKMKEWKKNFLRIKKLVLIGGPQDGVITPWQSSLFGFYDSNENVVGMRSQEFYKNDAFGLKTLDARGDLLMCVVPGVIHSEWKMNFQVFRLCMEKWLT